MFFYIKEPLSRLSDYYPSQNAVVHHINSKNTLVRGPVGLRLQNSKVNRGTSCGFCCMYPCLLSYLLLMCDTVKEFNRYIRRYCGILRRPSSPRRQGTLSGTRLSHPTQIHLHRHIRKYINVLHRYGTQT